MVIDSNSITSPESCIFEQAIFDQVWSRCDLEFLTSKSKFGEIPTNGSYHTSQSTYLTIFCLAVILIRDLLISKSKQMILSHLHLSFKYGEILTSHF